MTLNKKSREAELPIHTKIKGATKSEKKKSFFGGKKKTPEEAINEMRRKKAEKKLKTEKKKSEKKASEFKSSSAKRNSGKDKNGMNVRVIPLGGLGEIGKNMTVVETNDDLIIIDAGLAFPDDDMLGVDLVIPDITYLVENQKKIRGLFLTHGHEDHIGSIPYILQKINVPIYATKLTLGIIRNKLNEFGLDAELNVVKNNGKIKAGVFEVEFIPVNHSIADAVAFSVSTPCGRMIFTGDFKIDSTPIDGEITDLTRFGELGKSGVTALFCDSTNCERPGFTPSERTVGTSLDKIFQNNTKRVIVATFSSNIHRVQQIIDASVKNSRAVCILGRSMINIVSTANALGYMKIPDNVLIMPEELKRFKPENVTIITTGSQGEAMSALARMAFGSHDKVKLGSDDMVVISAHPIPGNEKTINNIINELTKKNVEVVYDQIAEVHVSGHACQEELKMIFALTKPRFFMPVHGEYKHLARNAALAEYAGIPKDHIFISDIGRVLEFSMKGKKAELNGNVVSGKVMVDGVGVGSVGSVVLRDRKILSQEGIIVIAATFDRFAKLLISPPEIISRGFIYVKENEDLISEIKGVATEAIEKYLGNGFDDQSIINKTKDDVSKFIFAKTKRKPMVMTVLTAI